MSTKIQWTDETWNPTTGCTKVSPGCANCYIERTPAFRIAGRKFDRLAHIPLRLHADRLKTPLHWRKPRRVFVNSLSDLFHDDVPEAFIERVFTVMAMARRHTFQVLTKRPARMRALLPAFAAQHTATDGTGWPLPNVWLGVSVENQHFADERIPLLLQTPAAVRFISAEPLLESVDFSKWLYPHESHEPRPCARCLAFNGPDWVIVGGESGPGARPFEPAWARSIVSQCKAAGVACFVKQLGANVGSDDIISAEYRPFVSGRRRVLHDKKGGDPAEWPDDLRVREYPA